MSSLSLKSNLFIKFYDTLNMYTLIIFEIKIDASDDMLYFYLVCILSLPLPLSTAINV